METILVPTNLIPENVIESLNSVYTEYKKTVITSIITAIVVLVTLAWNDVVQSIIAYYIPASKKNNIQTKFYYAVIVTIIVIALQIYVFPYMNQKS